MDRRKREAGRRKRGRIQMTDDERDAVMSTAIRHWKTNFAGISSLDVSREIGAPHDSVLEAFDELEQAGLATLNRDVTLVLIRLLSTPGLPREEPEQVVCSILFPSKEVLTEAFERERTDHGPFPNRLHKGDSQVAMCYFKIEVLSKYRDQPEKYHFDDDDMSGWITTSDAYCFHLPEAIRGQETVPSVRYGKRRLTGGGVAVAAILKDLAALPYKEQLYWCSFEIDRPAFTQNDSTFEKFVRQEFDAEFVDHVDPIVAVGEALDAVNKVVPLFQHTANPDLTYPFINNQKDYSSSHRELYKLVGPDNLDRRRLRACLEAMGEPFDNDAKARALFRKLVARMMPGESGKKFVASLNQNEKERNPTTHTISRWTLTQIDYVESFRLDCMKFEDGFRLLAELLCRDDGEERE